MTDPKSKAHPLSDHALDVITEAALQKRRSTVANLKKGSNNFHKENPEYGDLVARLARTHARELALNCAICVNLQVVFLTIAMAFPPAYALPWIAFALLVAFYLKYVDCELTAFQSTFVALAISYTYHLPGAFSWKLSSLSILLGYAFYALKDYRQRAFAGCLIGSYMLYISSHLWAGSAHPLMLFLPAASAIFFHTQDYCWRPFSSRRAYRFRSIPGLSPPTGGYDGVTLIDDTDLKSASSIRWHLKHLILAAGGAFLLYLFPFIVSFALILGALFRTAAASTIVSTVAAAATKRVIWNRFHNEHGRFEIPAGWRTFISLLLELFVMYRLFMKHGDYAACLSLLGSLALRFHWPDAFVNLIKDWAAQPKEPTTSSNGEIEDSTTLKAGHIPILCGFALIMIGLCFNIPYESIRTIKPSIELHSMAAKIRDLKTMHEYAWPFAREAINHVYRHVTGKTDAFIPSEHQEMRSRFDALSPDLMAMAKAHPEPYSRDEVSRLQYVCEELRALQLEAASKKLPVEFNFAIKTMYDQAHRLLQQNEGTLIESSRPWTIGVYIQGPAGVGKESLPELFCANIFSRPVPMASGLMSAEYDNYYNGEFALYWGEVGVFTKETAERLRQKFFDVFNSSRTFSNQSESQKKDRIAWRPRFGFMTSNVDIEEYVKGLVDAGASRDAVMRRLPVVLRATRVKVNDSKIDKDYGDLQIYAFATKKWHPISIDVAIETIKALGQIAEDSWKARREFDWRRELTTNAKFSSLAGTVFGREMTLNADSVPTIAAPVPPITAVSENRIKRFESLAPTLSGVENPADVIVDVAELKGFSPGLFSLKRLLKLTPAPPDVAFTMPVTPTTRLGTAERTADIYKAARWWHACLTNFDPEAAEPSIPALASSADAWNWAIQAFPRAWSPGHVGETCAMWDAMNLSSERSVPLTYDSFLWPDVARFLVRYNYTRNIHCLPRKTDALTDRTDRVDAPPVAKLNAQWIEFYGFVYRTAKHERSFDVVHAAGMLSNSLSLHLDENEARLIIDQAHTDFPHLDANSLGTLMLAKHNYDKYKKAAEGWDLQVSSHWKRYHLLMAVIGLTGAFAIGGLLWTYYKAQVTDEVDLKGYDGDSRTPKKAGPSPLPVKAILRRKPIEQSSELKATARVTSEAFAADPNARSLASSIANACLKLVTTKNGSCNALFICDRRSASVGHILDGTFYDDDEIKITDPQTGSSQTFSVGECNIMSALEVPLGERQDLPILEDLSLIDFPAQMNLKRNIAKHVCPVDQRANLFYGQVLLTAWVRDSDSGRYSVQQSLGTPRPNCWSRSRGERKFFAGNTFAVECPELPAGTCGGFAVALNPNMPHKLVGIIQSGCSSRMYCTWLNPEHYHAGSTPELPIAMPPQPNEVVDETTQKLRSHPGFTILGLLKPHYCTRKYSETALKPGLWNEWACDHHRSPAICGWNDCPNTPKHPFPPTFSPFMLKGERIDPVLEVMTKARCHEIPEVLINGENLFTKLRRDLPLLGAALIPPPRRGVPCLLTPSQAIGGVYRPDGECLVRPILFGKGAGLPCTNLPSETTCEAPCFRRGTYAFIRCKVHGNLARCPSQNGAPLCRDFELTETPAALYEADKAKLDSGECVVVFAQIHQKRDEPRDPKKHGRILVACPLHWNILEKQHFAFVFSGFDADPFGTGFCSHLNFHSVEIDGWYRDRMNFGSRGILSDFGSADWRCALALQEAGPWMVEGWRDRYMRFESPEERQWFLTRDVLLNRSCNMSVMCWGVVAFLCLFRYITGRPYTTGWNCCNYAAARYLAWVCYKWEKEHVVGEVVDYLREIDPNGCGDDSLSIAAPDTKFNQLDEKNYLENILSMEVTDPYKKPVLIPYFPVDKWQFLRRTPVRHGGHWHGALELRSIYRPKYYVRSRGPEEMLNVAFSIALELYEAGDRSLFKEWNIDAANRLREIGVEYIPRTWEDLERCWLSEIPLRSYLDENEDGFPLEVEDDTELKMDRANPVSDLESLCFTLGWPKPEPIVEPEHNVTSGQTDFAHYWRIGPRLLGPCYFHSYDLNRAAEVALALLRRSLDLRNFSFSEPSRLNLESSGDPPEFSKSTLDRLRRRFRGRVPSETVESFRNLFKAGRRYSPASGADTFGPLLLLRLDPHQVTDGCARGLEALIDWCCGLAEDCKIDNSWNFISDEGMIELNFHLASPTEIRQFHAPLEAAYKLEEGADASHCSDSSDIEDDTELKATGLDQQDKPIATAAASEVQTGALTTHSDSSTAPPVRSKFDFQAFWNGLGMPAPMGTKGPTFLREMFVKSFSWSTGVANMSALTSIQLPSEPLVANAAWANVMYGLIGARFGIALRFEANISPAAAGALGISFIPCPIVADDTESHSTNPYLRMNSAGSVIPTGNLHNFVMIVPYTWPKPYFKLADLNTGQLAFALGVVWIDVVAALINNLSGGPGSVRVDVYATVLDLESTGADPSVVIPMAANVARKRIARTIAAVAPTDVNRRVLTNASSPNSHIIIDETTLKSNWRSVDTSPSANPDTSKFVRERSSKKEKKIRTVAKPVPSVPVDESVPLPASYEKNTNIVAPAANGGVLNSIGRTLIGLVQTVGQTVQGVAPYAAPIIKAVAPFFLDKPLDERPRMVMFDDRQGGTPFSHTRTLEHATVLYSLPKGLVSAELGESPDAESLARMPSIMAVYTLTGAMTNKHQFALVALSPTHLCNYARTGAGPYVDTFNHSHLSYWSALFGEYSGDVDFLCIFVASPFVAARVRITYVPGTGSVPTFDPEDEGGDALSYVINVRGTMQYRFRVPFHRMEMTIPTSELSGLGPEAESIGGWLRFTIEDPLTTQDSTGTTSMYLILCVAAGPNFKLHNYMGYANRRLSGVMSASPEVLRQRKILEITDDCKLKCDLESCFEEEAPYLHPSLQTLCHKNFVHPEDETNIVQLLKRPDHVGAWPSYGPIDAPVEMAVAVNHASLIAPFMFYRGGTVHDFVSLDATVAYVGTANLYSDPFNDFSKFSGTGWLRFTCPAPLMRFTFVAPYNAAHPVLRIVSSTADQQFPTTYLSVVQMNAYTNSQRFVSAADDYRLIYYIGPLQESIDVAFIDGKKHILSQAFAGKKNPRAPALFNAPRPHPKSQQSHSAVGELLQGVAPRI